MNTAKNLFVITAILYSSSLMAQSLQEKEYVINGYVKGLPENTKIYLIKPNYKTDGFDTVLTTHSIEGNFTFKSKYYEDGELNFVKIDTIGLGLERKKRSEIALLIDSKQISLKSSFEEWPSSKITGSAASNDYQNLVREIEQHNKNTIKNNPDYLTKSYIPGYTNGLLNILKKYPQSIATPLITMNISSALRLIKLDTLYNSWPLSTQQSRYGKLVNQFNMQVRASEMITQGKMLPNFEFTTIKGDTVNIHQLISESKCKLTLIDFWASWCSPCRAEIPKLKKAHSEFGRQDFNIISISIDKRNKDWKDALNKEDMAWFQGLDSENKVAKGIFGIEGIPAYLLVDDQMKIIGFNGVLSPIKNFGPNLRNDQLVPVITNLLIELTKSN